MAKVLVEAQHGIGGRPLLMRQARLSGALGLLNGRGYPVLSKGELIKEAVASKPAGDESSADDSSTATKPESAADDVRAIHAAHELGDKALVDIMAPLTD